MSVQPRKADRLAGLDGHGQRRALLEAFAAARSGGSEAARVHGTAAYVSGDRQGEGLFPLWSVGRNLTIGSMARLARYGWLNRRTELAEANHWRDHLAIRTRDVDDPILSLSGGNQQKVLIARGLAGGADILLLDDPMRGVDLGTKRELFTEIRREAGPGKVLPAVYDGDRGAEQLRPRLRFLPRGDYRRDRRRVVDRGSGAPRVLWRDRSACLKISRAQRRRRARRGR